jgi:hypothetical protein
VQKEIHQTLLEILKQALRRELDPGWPGKHSKHLTLIQGYVKHYLMWYLPTCLTYHEGLVSPSKGRWWMRWKIHLSFIAHSPALLNFLPHSQPHQKLMWVIYKPSDV